MPIGGMKSIAVETLTHHDSRSLHHVVWSATIGILPPTRVKLAAAEAASG